MGGFSDFSLYYIVIILASFFIMLYQKIGYTKIFLIISFLLMFILMGFRETNVGIDTYQYTYIFNQVKAEGFVKYFLADHMEPGYLLLNAFVGNFTSDPHVIIEVTSFLGLFFYYKSFVYYREKIDLGIYLLMFGSLMYLYYFSIMRLFLAAAIVTYSFKYLFEQKYKTLLLLIILATTIHYSAAVMMFLVLISKYLYNSKIVNRIIIITIVGLVMLVFLVPSLFASGLGGRYAIYVVGQAAFGIFDFAKIPVIILIYVFLKDKFKSDITLSIFFKLTILLQAIVLITKFLPIGRLQWYLNFTYYYLLCYAYTNTKFRHNKAFLLIAIIVYTIVYTERLVITADIGAALLNYSNTLFK